MKVESPGVHTGFPFVHPLDFTDKPTPFTTLTTDLAGAMKWHWRVKTWKITIEWDFPESQTSFPEGFGESDPSYNPFLFWPDIKIWAWTYTNTGKIAGFNTTEWLAHFPSADETFRVAHPEYTFGFDCPAGPPPLMTINAINPTGGVEHAHPDPAGPPYYWAVNEENPPWISTPEEPEGFYAISPVLPPPAFPTAADALGVYSSARYVGPSYTTLAGYDAAYTSAAADQFVHTASGAEDAYLPPLAAPTSTIEHSPGALIFEMQRLLMRDDWAAGGEFIISVVLPVVVRGIGAADIAHSPAPDATLVVQRTESNFLENSPPGMIGLWELGESELKSQSFTGAGQVLYEPHEYWTFGGLYDKDTGELV